MRFLDGWKTKIGSVLGGIATFLAFLPPVSIATVGGEPVTATAVAAGLAAAFLGTGLAGKADKFIDATSAKK